MEFKKCLADHKGTEFQTLKEGQMMSKNMLNVAVGVMVAMAAYDLLKNKTPVGKMLGLA